MTEKRVFFPDDISEEEKEAILQLEDLECEECGAYVDLKEPHEGEEHGANWWCEVKYQPIRNPQLSSGRLLCKTCYAEEQKLEIHTCVECEYPIVEGIDRFASVELYDSPWQEKPDCGYIHVDDDWESDCSSRLYDNGWGDFRYFDCCECDRTVIQQSPRNGWHSFVREHPQFEEERICLKCFEDSVLEHGVPIESYMDRKIKGSFFVDSELEEAGWEKVDDFYHRHIVTDDDVNKYCKMAIDLNEQGYMVLNNYESLAIGGLEGYVTLYKKKKEDQ